MSTHQTDCIQSNPSVSLSIPGAVPGGHLQSTELRARASYSSVPAVPRYVSHPSLILSSPSLVPGSALAGESGAVAPIEIVSSVFWRVVVVGLIWVFGVLCGQTVAAPSLPRYQLEVESAQEGQSPLLLGPYSWLRVVLQPAFTTRVMPRVCAFNETELGLTRWPIPYKVAPNGAILIDGQVRELPPLAQGEQDLLFMLSGPLTLCEPWLVRAAEAVQSLTIPLVGRSGSDLIGTQVLRLPINRLPQTEAPEVPEHGTGSGNPKTPDPGHSGR